MGVINRQPQSRSRQKFPREILFSRFLPLMLRAFAQGAARGTDADALSKAQEAAEAFWA